ncbi:MAG: hypothetical protein NTV22_11665, partial [bacterium]|nr:hypothetical protein [bacterium]
MDDPKTLKHGDCIYCNNRSHETMAMTITNRLYQKPALAAITRAGGGGMRRASGRMEGWKVGGLDGWCRGSKRGTEVN